MLSSTASSARWRRLALLGVLALVTLAAAGVLWPRPEGGEAAGNLLRRFVNPTVSQDHFGFSVAAADGKILIGAPDRPGKFGRSAGSAYLYEANGNFLRAFHQPNSGIVDQQFGASVAFVGDVVLIGDPGAGNANGPDAGAAYLFDGNNGSLLQTFLDPGPIVGGNFGQSVAALGNDVLVGAPLSGPSGGGAVYLFDGTTGDLLRTFLSPTPTSGDRFGYSVVGFGGGVLVGAQGAETGGVRAGVVYLFAGGTGALLRTFANPDPQQGDSFGFALAGAGNNVLVSALGDSAQAVYLLDANTGNLVRSFLNPRPGFPAQFGRSVAMVGGNVLVGDPGRHPGTAFLLDATTGAAVQTISGSNTGSSFGFSVAAMGDNVLIGDPGDDAGAVSGGAAYLFEVGPKHTPTSTPTLTPTFSFYGTPISVGGFSTDLDGERGEAPLQAGDSPASDLVPAAAIVVAAAGGAIALSAAALYARRPLTADR